MITSKTDYYQLIYDILTNKGEEYSTRNPEIELKNTFSISALAWSSAKQIYWKMANNQHAESVYLSLAMTRGRAIHEFIQNRLLRHSFVPEYQVTYFTNDYIANKKGFELIGHIDAVNFRERQILEFKSTVAVGGERFPQWIVQCGAYCKLLSIETGLDFNGSIFCLNENTRKLTERKISNEDIENSWKVILTRAEETKLKVLGNND